MIYYFRKNGHYEAPAQGQDGAAFEVSTAGGLRGRQASSASRVAIATRQEKSVTSAKEGFASAKEGFATYEESFATDEESFATTQKKVMGDTLKFGK